MFQKAIHLVTERLHKVFSIDLRALAFFRIMMGFIIILYLIPKLINVYAFYSDWGILPRVDYFALINNNFFTFHLISGQTWVQVVLILLQMFIALLLIFGYRSRLMMILSWVFLISIQNRNPLVLNYGDQLFRLLLFWGMFLPIGAKWSIDIIWNKTLPKTKSWFSIATAAILLQVVLFYVVNFFLKDSIEWKGVFHNTKDFRDLFNFSEGFTAAYYAVNLTYLNTPFGRWLAGFPELLKASTVIYIYAELILPLLLLIPFKTKYFRYFSLAILFTYFHLMLQIMLYTGMFQFFCYAGLILFLTPDFWDNFEKIASKGKQSLKIYYDKECEFCTTGVCVLKGMSGSESMIPIQSNKELLGLGEEITTIIVVDDKGKKYTKIDAFIQIFSNSKITKPLAFILKLPLINQIATKFYEIIAKNRHHISTFIKFIKPNYAGYSEFRMLIVQSLAAVALVLVCFWNFENISKGDYFSEYRLVNTMYMLRLDQYWGMFANRPTQVNSWLVVTGNLRDGTKVDVLNKVEGEADFSRQDETPSRYWAQGWRNYFIDYPAYNNVHTKLLSRYLCNDWNRYNSNYSKQLKSLTVYAMEQRTLIYGRANPVQRFSLNYTC
jgi:predicted DCC family thiol-disulfide oxidoreductase YuxK